jgi:hypothetical protein
MSFLVEFLDSIKVFISWSGDRSKAMAEALRKWLPYMNLLVKPWMSEKDIGAGSLWFQETAKELSESKFGIFCITSDNLNEPWIHFEAGALFDIVGKQLHRICPYLLDLDPSDIKGPLSHFQAKQATKENTWEVLDEINKLGDVADQQIIKENFERYWPDLERNLKSINDMISETSVPERGTVDMIQELLELAREQSHVLFGKQNIYADNKERAEIIIKILKEGIYDDLPFSYASSTSSVAGSLASVAGSLRDWHNKETKEKLEKELLDMALGKK